MWWVVPMATRMSWAVGRCTIRIQMSGPKCQSSGPTAAMQVWRSEGRHETACLCLNYIMLTDFIRFALGVCSLNNKLYVVGGSDPCGQKGLKNCDTFDPVTKEWISCAPLNISECLDASPQSSSYLVWFSRSVSDLINTCIYLRREAPGSRLRVGWLYVRDWRSRVLELSKQCGALQSWEQHLDPGCPHERGSERRWRGHLRR